VSAYHDYNDHVSARVPKRRKVDLEFDTVESRSGHFLFHVDGKMICTIDKNYFEQRQRDFFEAISQPT